MATHYYRVGKTEFSADEPPKDPADHRRSIEPWLSAILQVEHVSLLLGSGLTTAVAALAGVKPLTMSMTPVDLPQWPQVEAFSSTLAQRSGRGEPNIEDQIRAMLAIAQGFEVLGDARAADWNRAIRTTVETFVASALQLEADIASKLNDETGKKAVQDLSSFLLTFASRAASRERLSVFTTNYDRLLEFACDLLGLRIIDRFVGSLRPVFRAARLEVDYHYNPPGIRGEPRYLEGVLRLHKLHGSVDWGWTGTDVVRENLPFGSPPPGNGGAALIYPNPAKDVETAQYPYAELFRDFSAALCRPNSVLVTYGYGFGDDHINRVISEMLTIPSTHLVVISYEDTGGRMQRFVSNSLSRAQLTLLIGPHFGDLHTLVDNYLPKPAIDQISWRQADLLRRRGDIVAPTHGEGQEQEDPDANAD